MHNTLGIGAVCKKSLGYYLYSLLFTDSICSVFSNQLIITGQLHNLWEFQNGDVNLGGFIQFFMVKDNKNKQENAQHKSAQSAKI